MDNTSLNLAALAVQDIHKKLKDEVLIDISLVLPGLQAALIVAETRDEPGERALTFLENVDPEIVEVAFADQKDTDDDDSDDNTANAKAGFRPNKSQIFVDQLLDEGLELIRDSQRVAYARYEGKIYPLEQRAGMDLITSLALDAKAGVDPGFLRSVVNALSALARFTTEESHDVYKRYAPLEDGVAVDIGDETNEIIHITATGVEIKPRDADIFINRPLISLPMARPVFDPRLKVDDLHEFFNVKDGSDLRLILSWAVAAMYPVGPYPILGLIGQAGSAKSEMAKKLNRLIDPSNPEVRTDPKDSWSMIVGTQNKSILIFDNMSQISDQMSDLLCVMATGGGYAVRALYSTNDEYFFDAQLPVAMTSIAAVSERPDLLSRSIQIYVPRLEPSEYKTEEYLDSKFKEMQPGIMALLFRALQEMIRNSDSIDTTGFENRMMDFTKRIGAMAPVLGWTPEEAMQAYLNNVDSADELILENHILADPLVNYLNQAPTPWEGSMTELKHAVEAHINHVSWIVGHPDWPKGVRQFRGQVGYLMPSISRVHGYIWEHGDALRSNKKRLHRFYRPDDFAKNDESDGGDISSQTIERGPRGA